jgi:hypothetical protein
MTEVWTRHEAVASVEQALQVWSTNVAGILTLALSAARAAQDEVEGVVRKRANEVAVLEDLLAAADNERSRQLQAKLVPARDAHERAKRASVRVRNIVASVSQLRRVHVGAAASQVATARAQLAAMCRALEGYISSGAVVGGGSGGEGTASVGGGWLSAMGLTDVEVSAADLDNNPILDDNGSHGTFGKGGLSRADYRWAVQTWNDTVGPGVASGKTREDFAERDARLNARPLRRMADVYDMFLGTDRIRADRQSDGSLHILSGRHRLLIARELGVRNLPGEVS